MPAHFGHDVLAPFDVWADAQEFLAEMIEWPHTPRDEVERLLHGSLLAGFEDWHYLVDCAKSIEDAGRAHRDQLDGDDVLTYLWYASELSEPHESPSPSWAQTDSLIAKAKGLEQDGEALIRALQAKINETPVKVPAKSLAVSAAKPRPQGKTSHYWSNEHQPAQLDACSTPVLRTKDSIRSSKNYGPSSLRNGLVSLKRGVSHSKYNQTLPGLREDCDLAKAAATARSPTKSHYFTSNIISPTESCLAESPSSKRPPAGTVSSVPFPPLTNASFGIIQEKLAHDPFWLLIAITFLIKTRGTQAIPTFYQVKKRFPSPAHLADPNIKEELLEMIRHLGLPLVRFAYIQKYAKAFMETPPMPGVVYAIKSYGRKGPGHLSCDLQQTVAGRDVAGTAQVLREAPEAWEIGHMTSGKYAIDSWRIFCRDELLGLAQDWNGKGREPEFQPEWMRVMPDDKELRACLRWMWMREGWEWDPATGARTVLRGEMQNAVNEGRVGYDNAGGLRILADGQAGGYNANGC